MRIVYFGTPQFAVPSLEAFLQHPDFEVAAVVTQPDKRRGRGGKVMPSPVKAIAAAAQIPVWQPRRIKKDEATLADLQAVAADAFVVVAYGQILSPEILAMPRWGCINGHGSLLPAYRGAAPIQWSLYHGEPQTGITTMQMDAGMDTGPMLLRKTLAVGLLDTAMDLAIALADLTAPLLIETLQQLEAGTLLPTPQPEEQATYAPLIQKSDFQLDWSRSAIALHNQVRGFYPNCVTPFRGSDLKVLATVPLGIEQRSHLPPEWQTIADQVAASPFSAGSPGEILTVLKAIGPVVQTGSGPLLLRQVKPSGKQAQTGWDFANGNRLKEGEQFVTTPAPDVDAM
ncbi:MAG: methionyl-tRNA formyltransferase [Cyanobacteria bacterium]|nr:methionyl-tRNA formyltransferase [Cyanobacteriota bacterium]